MVELKGYYVSTGYFGWAKDRYILFATIDEYYEYMRDDDDDVSKEKE